MSRAMGPLEKTNYKALVLEFVPLSSNYGAKLAFVWFGYVNLFYILLTYECQTAKFWPHLL